jgi:tRNA G10  N-methylase Trm11
VLQADCRKLPIKSGSIRSIIIDPPFLATTGKSLQSNNGNIINRRFSVARSERELAALYEAAIMEANRVLCPGGILVFKCQDKVSSGKQYMMHCLSDAAFMGLTFHRGTQRSYIFICHPEKAEQYRSLLGAFLKTKWGGANENKAPFTEERTEGFVPISIR